MAEVLGGFELIAPLGRGAQAQVWRAVHQRSHVPVAVKRWTRESSAFRREFRAFASIDHPHVVRILDGSATARWLAMELAEDTLAPRVGILPWDVVRRIAMPILRALSHIHARGLLHLDLKPSNVLVGCRRAEDEPLPDAFAGLRVADFGAAVVGAHVERLATPQFAAPELMSGGTLAPTADLYSVGALCLALIDDPTPAAGWLERLTRQDPADRPQTAAEALRLLAETRSSSVPFRPMTVDGPTVEVTTPITPTDRSTAAEVTLPDDWRAHDLPAWADHHYADAGLGLFGLRETPLVGREAERDALGDLREAVARAGFGDVPSWVEEPELRLALRRWLTGTVDADHAAIWRHLQGERPWVAVVDREAVELREAVLDKAPTGPCLVCVVAEEGPNPLAIEPLDDFGVDRVLRLALPLTSDARSTLLQSASGRPGKALALLRQQVQVANLVPTPEGYGFHSELALPARSDDPPTIADVTRWFDQGRLWKVRRILAQLDETALSADDRAELTLIRGILVAHQGTPGDLERMVDRLAELPGERARAGHALLSAVVVFNEDGAAASRWLQQALEAAETLGDQRLAGGIRVRLGWRCFFDGDLERAREHAESAWTTGDPIVRARAAVLHASLATHTRKPDPSRLQVVLQTQLPLFNRATVLRTLALALAHTDPDAALAPMQEASALYRLAGSVTEVGQTRQTLGYLHLVRGEHADARDQLVRALAAAREAGLPDLQVRAMLAVAHWWADEDRSHLDALTAELDGIDPSLRALVDDALRAADGD